MLAGVSCFCLCLKAAQLTLQLSVAASQAMLRDLTLQPDMQTEQPVYTSYNAAAFSKCFHDTFAPVTVQAYRQKCILFSLSPGTLYGLPRLKAQSCLEGSSGLSLETNG